MVERESLDSHAARLPLLRERLQLPEDDPNPRLPDLLRQEVRLTPSHDGEPERRVESEGLFDLRFERDERRDDVRALSIDHQWRLALHTGSESLSPSLHIHMSVQNAPSGSSQTTSQILPLSGSAAGAAERRSAC